jgi:cytoskeletal protein CcmA (bactofilin family)
MPWWDKKGEEEDAPKPVEKAWVPPAAPKAESPKTEATPKVANPIATNQNPTVLGRSVVSKGEITASEDLLIEGQFEGTINLKDHCLTVGTSGQVKAEVQARQVVIQGTVNGNISAREKVEIRKTGRVQGDLTAAGVAIEDGAYFKGSIEIQRDDIPEAPRIFSAAASAVAAKSEKV